MTACTVAVERAEPTMRTIHVPLASKGNSRV